MDERLSIDPEACLSASRNTFNLSSLLFVSRFGIPLRHLSFSPLLSLFRLRFQIPLHLLHPQLSPKTLVNLSDFTPGRLHEVICLCMAGLRCLRGCYLHAGHLPVLRHLLRRPGLSSYPTNDEGRYPSKRRYGDENINEGAPQALGWKDSGPLLKHACPRPTPYLNSPALLAPPLLITTKFTCRHEKVLNGALASCCNSLPLILYNDRSGRGFKSGS